jgi:hypothetical protein
MMVRETIIGALLAKLTSPPLVFNFTADTTTGDTTLANVSDTSGLLVGMPVTGDGLPTDAVITAISPVLTLSLAAITDRTASPMTQGFQTVLRRLINPNTEQDMPMLCLIEHNETHTWGEGDKVMVDLNCEAWIYTTAGADRSAVPAATLNMLIDGIERAIYPTPKGYRQNLGVNGVLYCRINGEIIKDPGHDGNLAGAVIPLQIHVGPNVDSYLLS